MKMRERIKSEGVRWTEKASERVELNGMTEKVNARAWCRKKWKGLRSTIFKWITFNEDILSITTLFEIQP